MRTILILFLSFASTLSIVIFDQQEEEDLVGSLVAFDTTPENYTVPISGKCILTCYVAEVRSFKVLWQKIDRPMVNQSNDVGGQEQLTLIAFDGVVYSNKDHYRLESDYVGSYNLIIDRVNEDDQGEYQCQINTEPRKTKRIFLTVQVPPRISDFRPNPPLLTIPFGSSLTFFCRAEGTPMPRIRWRVRDLDQTLIETVSPPENSNVWFIPSISRTFPRTIECIADNGVLPASNRIFTIHVEYPPIVQTKNDLIPSQLNDNVTLECSIVSRPFARISWEKNGEKLFEHQMINTRINQTMSISRVQLQMKQHEDFGQYTCIAENSHGRTDALIFVLQQSMIISTLPTLKTASRHSRYTTSMSPSPSTSTLTSTTRWSHLALSSNCSSLRLSLNSLSMFVCFLFLQLRRRYSREGDER